MIAHVKRLWEQARRFDKYSEGPGGGLYYLQAWPFLLGINVGGRGLIFDCALSPAGPAGGKVRARFYLCLWLSPQFQWRVYGGAGYFSNEDEGVSPGFYFGLEWNERVWTIERY